MPLKINGSTSGSVTLAAPATGSDVTLTLPGSTGTVQTVPGAWTTFTPTIGGTGWAIGNGTRTGQYTQVGKTVSFMTTIVWGSTSTFGAGWLEVSLPVSALTSVSALVYANDVSTGNNYGGFLVSSIYPLWITSTAGLLDGTISTRPFTWASGDTLRIVGTYEAA